MSERIPSRGEIWMMDLDGRRPALVVSADPFNHGPAELLLALPVTSGAQGIPSHVPVGPGASGLDGEGFVVCEQVRCVARSRLVRRMGRAPRSVMDAVARYLRVVLEL